MAVLHKEFIKYNKELKLTSSRSDSLKSSRKELRKKMRNWFKENKPDELQPKFGGQGSFMMGTTINPIPEYDDDGNKILKYDLDDGVYFIEKDDEDNKKSINTWHNWIFDSVEGHTSKDSTRKTTCVRVNYADGHHIDLPIYYKKDDDIQLAHKSKDWIDSDPKEFYQWFNSEKNAQKERFVRYFKGWKNYREINNSGLKLPSGFEFTILVVKHYVADDNDDKAFRDIVRKMYKELSNNNGFKCIRPTTPEGGNVFENYSETRKNNFLNTLSSLLKDLNRANDEKNFMKASEILRDNQFGDRFPLGEDKDEKGKNNELNAGITGSQIKPKPYGY